MARIVKLQFCVTFFVAIIAALLSSLLGQKMGGVLAVGISALLGGLCCVIPSALFALRLYAGTKKAGGKAGGINPTTFFVGEFLKILLTVVLLMAVIWLYRDLNWLAFLVGMIVVLKSYLILLFRNQI